MVFFPRLSLSLLSVCLFRYVNLGGIKFRLDEASFRGNLKSTTPFVRACTVSTITGLNGVEVLSWL